MLAVCMAVTAGACGLGFVYYTVTDAADRHFAQAVQAGERVASETLRDVLRLQEASIEGWRTMADLARASLQPNPQKNGSGPATTSVRSRVS